MTTFITESISIDLSLLKIKFSDENTIFEKGLIKQYSFPFKIPKDLSYIPFFDFIESHNSVGSNYIKGILFHNDKYYEAELLVLGISKKIEAMFYYNLDKLTIFDQPLSSLPWGSLNIGDNIYTFADSVAVQDYPTTLINFPKINDPEKYIDYEFGQFPYAGFINNNENSLFRPIIFETIPGLTFTQMNEMRPFMYLKEVVKFIFEQINYTVTGDFMSNDSIAKCLLYHDNAIFYTNEDFSETTTLAIVLSQSDVSGFLPPTTVYNQYSQNIVMVDKGYYKATVNVEGTIQVSGNRCFVQAYFNNVLIKAVNAYGEAEEDFNIDLEFNFDVPAANAGDSLEIRIIATAATFPTIEGEIEVVGTVAPIYSNVLEYNKLFPDMKVGEFIEAVKESFNMNSTFKPSTQTVDFSFFESFIDSAVAVDLSHYEIDSVPRKLNKSIGFKIPFSDGEILNLNKEGEFVSSEVGFTEITIPIEPLPVVAINGVDNLKHQDGVSMLFYTPNVDAMPLIVDGNIIYSRLGFVHAFLRTWLFQKLNSEEYSVKFNLPLYIAAKITSQSKIWFYNNFFLVHSLKRQTKTPLFENLNMRLFKLKSIPEFILEITDGGNDDVPVTAVISASGTTFPLSIITGVLVIMSAQNSTGNITNYLWELIASPVNSDCVILSPTSYIASLSGSYINENIGVYTIKLTVSNNTFTDSTTIDITITS